MTAAAPASSPRLIQLSAASGTRITGTVGVAASAISIRVAVSTPISPCSRSMIAKSKPVPATISATSGLGSASQQPISTPSEAIPSPLSDAPA